MFLNQIYKLRLKELWSWGNLIKFWLGVQFQAQASEQALTQATSPCKT